MSEARTKDEVLALLRTADWDQLQGCPETEEIEFKGEPYPCQDEHRKLELAKDVSALANASGGIIVLGVATMKNPVHRGDEVSTCRPFESNLWDPKKWDTILRDWLTPYPVGLTFEPIPSKAAEKVLGVIHVQPHPSKAILVIRTALDETGRVVGHLFGHFKRYGVDVSHASSAELQAALAAGLNLQVHLGERLDRIEGFMSRFEVTTRKREAPDTQITGRIGQAIGSLGLQERPTFVLAASPKEDVTIHGLFEGPDSEVVRLLRRPSQLRDNGFDLYTGQDPKIVEGKLRRSMVEGRVILELWEDGTLIFCVPMDEEYLCIAPPDEATKLLINPLALVESTYLFCVLLNNLALHALPRPFSFNLHLQLRKMETKERPILLLAGAPPDRIGPIEYHSLTATPGRLFIAPASDVHVQVSARSDKEPGVVAFDVVKKLYAWFGAEHSRVPYVGDLGNQRGIDHRLIRMASS